MPHKNLLIMNERIFGVISFIIACGYIYVASLTQLSFISDPVGPKTFPYIIGSIFAVSSLFLIFKPEFNPQWPSLYKFLEIIFVTIILIVYAYSLPVIGFVISTLIATFILSWRLGAKLTEAIIFGAVISFGIYFLFRTILGISLAKGIWGF
jgi:putative tricarboxylic transport membrane protein